MNRQVVYRTIFSLTGALFIATGVIAQLLGSQFASLILASIGTTIISIVLVNFLWEQSGGEPVLRALEMLRSSSQIVNDSMDTGIFNLYEHRRAIDYQKLNSKIADARNVFVLSLVFKVTQSLQIKQSIIKCVGSGGRVRIVVSDPGGREMEHGDTDVPAPLRLRMIAEKDTENHRMSAEIVDTLDFLMDLKSDLSEREGAQKAARFEVRVLSSHVIYFSLLGIDEEVLVTTYSNKHRGLDSPTMTVRRTSSPRALYGFYRDEFDYLWRKATPVKDRPRAPEKEDSTSDAE